MTQSEASHNLEATEKELATLEEQEQQLRQEVERVEGKREWVEEFRIWVETLGKFLEEKVSYPTFQKAAQADSSSFLSSRTSKRMRYIISLSAATLS